MIMRQTVNLEDGRKVTVVGTAHVSDKSVDEVRESIEELKPDFVGVELDENRLESLRDKDGWKGLDVSEAIRDGKGSLLAFNLLMSVYQRRIGIAEGVEPGSEMLEAVEAAEESGMEFDTIDQDISVTLQKVKEELGLFDKFKLLASLAFDGSDIEVEELKESDMLTEIVEELEEEFPGLKKAVLDDRNRYMAEKVLEREFEHALIFVGAAHVEGIAEELQNPTPEPKVEAAESVIPWKKTLKYGLPVFIISMLAYSFLKIGMGTGIDAVSFWILSNGLLAMLGAIIARAKPLTWLVSFVAAPLTSLDPALGAGMVASYFEARFYPPTVEELESIIYTERYRDLWGNQVGRILLTFVFVSIGSATATFLSAGYIASLITAV